MKYKIQITKEIEYKGIKGEVLLTKFEFESNANEDKIEDELDSKISDLISEYK